MDVISSLPDEMLTKILSVISLKEAAQTCILSKRWRNQWSFVPVAKFNIEDWVDTDTDTAEEEELAQAEIRFQNHLNGFLNNRAPSQLEEFEYKNAIKEYESDVSLDFLDRVALLKPRVVCIEVCRENSLNIPDLIFSCPRLEELSLSVITEDVTNISPAVVNLRSVKILKLGGIVFNANNGLMQKIFLGCPALESLDLKFCTLDISELSSDALKKLSIMECLELRKIRIVCPNLTSLNIEPSREIDTPGFELKCTASLEYAHVYMELQEDHDDINLLNSLLNVNHLSFCLWSIRFEVALKNEIPKCGTFSNLKNLIIEFWDLSSDIALVICFLKNSPCLEELTLCLHKSLEEDNTEARNQDELRNVSFQREYLKTVKIVRPSDEDVETDRLVNKLLTHIKTIQNIIILYDAEYIQSLM